jgi:hypothetical protein
MTFDIHAEADMRYVGILIVALCFGAACSSSERGSRVAREAERTVPPTSTAQENLTSAGTEAGTRLGVGAGCQDKDGWVPPEVPEMVAAAGKGPTAVAVNAANRVPHFTSYQFE